jgi:signal transduction histidine kinase
VVKDGRALKPDELPVQMAARGMEVRESEIAIHFDDGAIVYLLGNAIPLSDVTGRPRGSVAAFVDITERKKRESFSQERIKINRLIYSTLDIDQVIQTALDTAVRALGSESGAISLRKGDEWLASYIHGMPRAILGQRMNDDEERHGVLAIQTEKVVAIDDGFSDARVNRDHLRKWNVRSVMVVPMTNKQGVTGVLFLNYHSVAHRFTQAEIDFGTELAATLTLALENAQLYANIQQHAATLEQTVEERTKQLQNAIAELEHFSYTVTHDLRAPLRAMKGFTGMMREGDCAACSSEMAKDFLDRVAKAAQKMDNVIQDSLDFARAARADMQLDPVNVEQSFKAILNT